ncbi:Nucleoside 5-triphosphatase RdgB (dHAPTP, dITP, XTP-specific) [hydrothermal vent metagenome]|uniref:dITP/XTP pyrophosphatase n=1 Tax=hydrothermal vent metagenome TaxID=652676 RepID=A0A3B0UJU2_9ZZZZ
MSDELSLKAGTKLVIATHNAGKLSEFKTLFAPFKLELVSAGELGLDEPEETGTSFAQNASLKAHAAAQASGLLALADDSGLCVAALGGRPGIHTARWAMRPTEDKKSSVRDFSFGMQRVENELQATGATSPAQRGASFCATLCLAHPNGDERIFEGIVSGTLVWPPRGDLGFGFDPVFMPKGFDISFGQMSSEKKHSWAPGQPGLSHRARAFALMVEDCCDY